MGRIGLTVAETANLETKDDAGKPPQATNRLWQIEIKAYDKTFDAWQKRAAAVVKRYRNEGTIGDADTVAGTNKFNVLWANVQTLQPALYSKVPKPDITRTHKDKNQIARAAAVILERATRQEIVTGGFDEAMRCARDDYLLTARGQAWVRYVPTYGDETREKIFLQADPNSGEGMPSYTRQDGEPYEADPKNPIEFEGEQAFASTGEPYRPVVSECVKQEHINWKDFGHTPAPTWSKVRAVWKREMMTRTQLIERFGEKIGKAMSLTKGAENIGKDDLEAYGDAFKRGEVYEIWDKTSRKVIWISEGYTEGPLDEIDDPLKLEGFFPCPPPVYGTTTTDSLIPVTDYDEYRTQADEIDVLTQRISILTRALKIGGAYDSQFEALGKILNGAENTLVAIDGWAMFAEKGGIAGVMSFLPIKEIAETIVALGTLREQLKRDLQEITGIADIVRGQSDPNETLGAQEIKRQFVGMRIEDRQSAMGRFARGIVQITAEIIAEQFSPETLREISGWDSSDEARALDKDVADWEKAQQAAQQQAQQPPPMGLNGGPPMEGMDPSMGQPNMGGMPPDMMGQPPGALPMMDGQGVDPTGMAQPGMMPPEQAQQVPAPPPTERPPTSQEIFDQAVELLRSDKLRGYTIEVDTDTMVFQDQQQEQQNAIELVTSVSGYLKEAVPAAMQYPALAPVLIEMLMLTVRKFKAGPSLEAVLESAMTALSEQPPATDPNAEAAAAQAENEKQKLALEGERVAIEREKTTHAMQTETQRVEIEGAKALADSQPEPPPPVEQDNGADLIKIESDRELAEQKMAAEQVDKDRAHQLAEIKLAAEDAERTRKHELELAKLALEERKFQLEAERVRFEAANQQDDAGGAETGNGKSSAGLTALTAMVEQLAAQSKAQQEALTAPKRVIREGGKIVGVETVQ